MVSETIYYETGRSNTGDIERYDTKQQAMHRAKQIAREYGESVFVEQRTDDDLLNYWEVVK